MADEGKPDFGPDYVVHEIDAGTWSVQKKAVPGFRLGRSTMRQRRQGDLTMPPRGESDD